MSLGRVLIRYEVIVSQVGRERSDIPSGKFIAQLCIDEIAHAQRRNTAVCHVMEDAWVLASHV